jgi:hypothetical protein
VRPRSALPAALFLALAALVLVPAALAPAGARAAAGGSVEDPIGDTPEYAPDLGTTTVQVGDDGTLAVRTAMVPRPPAFWGGCAYMVVGTCFPADMKITWYLDWDPGTGSLAEGGADAKVLVVPSRGTSFWESARWEATGGRFVAGARPAVIEEAEAVGWTLRLGDLGIPAPASLNLWIVSSYASYNGLGTLLEYTDKAGPATIAIPGQTSVGTPVTGTGPTCEAALLGANSLQRQAGKLHRAIRKAVHRLRRTRRAARKTGARAHRHMSELRGRLAHLRRRLAQVRRRLRSGLDAARGSCGTTAPEPGPPPSTAPPGCTVVTRPVLQQEGTGISAPWVIKNEPVVECGKGPAIP